MLKTSVLNPLARSVSSLAREDGACPRSAASTPGQDIRPRSPIRVCFLIDRLLRAGTEGQLLMLIRHLDRSRVEPLLCLLDGEDDLSRSLEPADCPVLRLGVRSLHHPSTLARALSFARFLRRHRVDVVQIYYPDSTYLGVPVARLVGIPRVVHTRFNLGYWMTPLHRWLARVANRFVDATVTNCEACRASVIADEWPARGSVVVLENGIDLSRFEGIGPVGGAGRPRRVGLAANLRPVKEPGLFVRAAALVARDHPDLAFQLAGEGELRPDLERLISELGLGGRVELLGRVEDMPAFLDGLDVAVLCSRSEGLPNAILEYMAAGRAVVATAVGGTVDLIEDGVHGLLVPPGDPGRLAGAIDRLLGDPGLAARLGAAARLRALERYGAGARARRYEAFYERLVSGI